MRRIFLVFLFVLPFAHGMKRGCLNPEAPFFIPCQSQDRVLLTTLCRQARSRAGAEARETLDLVYSSVNDQLGEVSDENEKREVLERFFQMIGAEDTKWLMLRWANEEMCKGQQGDLELVGRFGHLLSLISPRGSIDFGSGEIYLEYAGKYLPDFCKKQQSNAQPERELPAPWPVRARGGEWDALWRSTWSSEED